jgi:hypothetical protein
LQVNPNARVRVDAFLGVPVLIIDDFYKDPDAVRRAALRANYNLSVAFYPGRHAELPADVYAEAAQAIAGIASRLGDRRYFACDLISDFSILTTLPADLLPGQQHPHIDPTPALGLVYLTPGSSEGTSFYHNEMLGFSVVKTPEQRRALSEFLELHGNQLAPGSYDFTGHAVWKRLYTIEPVFNRFVLYPGNVFHAVDVKHVDEVIDMTRVRITQRFIVERTHDP